MGGDGGVIAVKRKYLRSVNEKDDKEAETKQTRENLTDKASMCAYSGQPLGDRIVTCELGNLYNKEALLEGLMNKSVQAAFPHIRGLRDLKDLSFTENTNVSSKEVGSKYMCPITRMEFNGLHPFLAVWTTGKVLSEKALKEMGISELQLEFGPFTMDDLINILPNEEQLALLKARMEKIRAAQKSEKESKKRGSAEVSASGETMQGGGEGKKKMTKAEAIAKSAAKNIDEQSSSSKVFKNLFHKDQEKDKHDRDLFMSVAGIRYTLR